MGGAERQLLYMLKSLANTDVDPEVLCLTKGEALESEIDRMGIRVRWIGSNPGRIVRLGRLIRELRSSGAEVIQSSHFYTNIYAGFAGRALGIPSIGAIRSDLASEIRLHGRLGKLQLKAPAFLIANTELARDRALKLGIAAERIEFVRNVVETRTRNGVPSTSDGELNLLFVGRLDRNKRPDAFVRLAAALTRKFPERALRFSLAGDGEMMPEIRAMTRDLGLPSERLELLGQRKCMDEIYRRADILVSTSVREGTSNVLLEAMAYGIPVVATAVGGTPEIISEERGILVDPDDEQSILSAAEELMNDGEKRRKLGENGKDFVSRNHSIEYLGSKLTEIYGRLCKGRES